VRGSVAEDKSVIVLSRLISNYCGIGAACRGELVFSNVADPAGGAEKESLNSDDIDRINGAVSIDVRTYEPASGQAYLGMCSAACEVPLGGNYIRGVDICSTRNQASFGRRNGIVTPRR